MCHARVNAGGAQKFQLFAAVFPCGMNHIHFQRHVVIHKVRQSVLVGDVYKRQVQERLRKVIIEHLDFEQLIRTYDRPNALFYCDTP